MREQSSAFVPGRVPFPAPVRGGLGVLAVGPTRPARRLALAAAGPVSAGIGRAVPAAVLAATRRGRGSAPAAPLGPTCGGSVPRVDAATGLADGAAGCGPASSAVPGPGGPAENRERPGTGTGRLAAVRTGAGS